MYGTLIEPGVTTANSCPVTPGHVQLADRNPVISGFWLGQTAWPEGLLDTHPGSQNPRFGGKMPVLGVVSGPIQGSGHPAVGV